MLITYRTMFYVCFMHFIHTHIIDSPVRPHSTLSLYIFNITVQANKPEAERARDLGAAALKGGELNRAIKLLGKSVQLYPLPGVDALLSQAKKQLEQSTTTNNNNNTTTSSSNARRSSAAAAPASAASGGNGSGGGTDAKSGRSYSADQVKMCQDILKAKEGGRGAHYRILGIPQNATEAQIKKAYRKLALKLHPDKNSAPHADEAFKAVGLAYGTLSDPQKRTIYDRYGEEDPDNRGGGGGGNMARHFRGRGGGAQEVSPEDIFNMFFGGGAPGGGGGMHRGPGGFHVYSNGFGFGGGGMPQGFRGQRQGPGQQQQRQQQQAQGGGFAQLLQLLPLILIMLLSFFNFNDSGGIGGGGSANMPGMNKYFSLVVSEFCLLWCMEGFFGVLHYFVPNTIQLLHCNMSPHSISHNLTIHSQPDW